jgi:hypothetical protein
MTATERFVKNDFAKCIRVATSLIEADPACPSAYLLRAHSRIDLGQRERGLEDLRQARRLVEGGCRLANFLREDLQGICEVSVDLVNDLRRDARTAEEARAWFLELMDWLRVLGRLSIPALKALAKDPLFKDVEMHLRGFCTLAELGLLGKGAGHAR